MDSRKPDGILIVALNIIVAVAATIFLFFVVVNPVAGQQVQQQAPKLDITPEIAELTVRQRCSNCHAVEADKDSFAPPLFGVIGRKAGSYKDFAYSPKISNLNITWTAAALDDWLAGTTFKTPDIRQRHVGIENPELRRAAVAYISTLK